MFNQAHILLTAIPNDHVVNKVFYLTKFNQFKNQAPVTDEAKLFDETIKLTATSLTLVNQKLGIQDAELDEYNQDDLQKEGLSVSSAL